MQPKVSAILLAAGLSRRMGSCKQLLPLGGKPVIVSCLDRIIGAGVGDIVVVVGPRGEAVADAVRHLPVTLVSNLDPESDMAGSARAGMKAVSSASTGILVCLSDHPLVSPDTYRSLLLLHGETPESILVPVHEGTRGHPTLFPRTLLDELTAFPALRDIVRAYPERVRLVDVADWGVTLDIDTREDYREALKTFKSRP